MMSRRQTAIVVKATVLALFLLAAPPVSSEYHSGPKPKLYDVPEAYGVYAALLPKEWTWQEGAHYLVIQEETDAAPFFESVRKCYPSTQEFLKTYQGVIGDFEKVNQEPRRLAEKFEIAKHYQLVPKDTIRALFGSWESFYASFPESLGYIDVSAVGFNADKTQALVYIGHACGNLCGGGTYHLLQKKNGKWEEAWPSGCMWAS